MRNLREHRDVEDIETGVAERLAVEHAGRRSNCRAPRIDVAWVDEGGVDAEAAQRVVEQVVRAAVQGARGDDVRTHAGDGCEAQMQGGLATRCGETCHAAFERGNPLFEYCSGGVGDTRIHMARALHVE